MAFFPPGPISRIPRATAVKRAASNKGFRAVLERVRICHPAVGCSYGVVMGLAFALGTRASAAGFRRQGHRPVGQPRDRPGAGGGFGKIMLIVFVVGLAA